MGAGKSFPGIDSMHTYPMKGTSDHEPDSEKLVATEEDRSLGPARFLRNPRNDTANPIHSWSNTSCDKKTLMKQKTENGNGSGRA